MSDNKKYYYIKLKDSFFDERQMKLLEGMKDGYMYEVLYLKMILLSLPMEGELRITEAIPYTAETLASVVNMDVGNVDRGVKALSDLGLIELMDDETIFMNDIQLFIGSASTEADRIRAFRKRKAAYKCTPEIREQRLETRDKRLDTRDNNKEKRNKENKEKKQRLDNLVSEYNRICTDFPRVTSLGEKRKSHAYARMSKFGDDDFLAVFEKAQASDYLSGRSGVWKANWDWFMASDNNMEKVLAGNYDNVKKRSGMNGLVDAFDGRYHWED